MSLQYVATTWPDRRELAALASQARRVRDAAYESVLLCSKIVSGGPWAAQSLLKGQVGATSPLSLCKTDRSNTCKTNSKPSSRWVWLPQWQLAHSPQKKNSSLSSPNRSRLSPSTTANTSNVGFRLVSQEQAAGRPVPVSPRPFKQGSRPC